MIDEMKHLITFNYELRHEKTEKLQVKTILSADVFPPTNQRAAFSK